MNKNTEKICLTIIRWLSCLILLIPFLIYRRTLFPYIFPKIICFQILVEIIFAAWLILLVSKKKYRPKWENPLILSLTIFIGILFLTMFFGVDLSRSFWSTQERMTGVLTMFHFYLWFLVLTSCFKGWKEWRKFIWISLLSSFLVGLYAIGQKLNFQFLFGEGEARLSSTLGNPIFLSVFAMLHVFLAGFLTLIEKKWFWKTLAVSFLIFNLVIMTFGASRGVILSFGLSLFLFLVYLIFVLSSKKIKIVLFVLLFIIICGFIFSAIFLPTQKNKPWVYKAPVFLQRMTYFKTSFWDRIIAWQIAFQGFKERPISGWGWENYNTVFNKYYHPQYLEFGLKNTWFDKSHNQVMDLLVLTGVLGIISYFSVFFFLFYLLYKKIRKEIETSLSKKVAIGILGLMFVTYFIQNLFVFDTPASLIIFYFGLGLFYFVTAEEREEEEEKGIFFPIVLILLIIIFLPLSIYKFNVKPFIQSRLTHKAASISRTDLKGGLVVYKKALEKSCFTNPEIRTQLMKSVANANSEGKTEPKVLKESFEMAISEMEKSIKEHPLNVRYYLFLGQLYNTASSFNKDYLIEAEEVFKKALELSPRRQEIYHELGWANLIQGKNEEAISFFKEALLLNEKIATSHWNLGLAYISAKKYEEGLAEIEEFLKISRSYGSDPNAILFIAQAHAEVSDFSKAIYLCDVALYYIDDDSSHAKAMSQKAIYLVKSGKKPDALKLVEEVSKIDSVMGEELKEVIESL